MTAAAKTKTARKPARKLTPAQLMADPKHMLEWLRTKAPRTVVAEDVTNMHSCLGTAFLRAKGFDDAEWLCSMGRVKGRGIRGCDAIADAISALMDGPSRVTARRAIAAITRATA